jgi:hypothetical protein
MGGHWGGNTIGGIAQVCSDATANQMYAVDYHGEIWYSSSAQTATTANGSFVPNNNYTNVSTKIPWPSSANSPYVNFSPTPYYLGGTASGLAADCSQPNRYYYGSGIGIVGMSPPTSATAFTWNFDEGVGTENLDVNALINVPGGGFLYWAQDLPAWPVLPGRIPAGAYPPDVNANNKQTLVQTWSTGCAGQGLYFTVSDFTEVGLRHSSDGSTWSEPPDTKPNNGAYGNCVVQNSTSWIWMLADQGNPGWGGLWSTINSGGTYSACSFTGATNTGGGFLGGVISGNYRVMAKDAGSNVLVYNAGNGATNGAGAGGFWKSTSATGCSFTHVNSTQASTWGASAFFSLQAAPGKTCDAGITPVFWTFVWNGSIHNGTQPQTQSPYYLWYSKDCGTTWSSFLSGSLSPVYAYGFGANGSDGFPMLVCSCWYNDGSGYKYGIWQFENADTGSPTATNIDAAENGWPAGVYDDVVDVAGDVTKLGTYMICFGHGSCAYRTSP